MTEPDSTHGQLRRLDAAERNLSDHARTITAFTNEFQAHDARIRALEEAHQEQRVTDAGEVERAKATQADITQIKDDIKSIKGTGSKALWVFISAIIVAFAGFIIKGGFA